MSRNKTISRLLSTDDPTFGPEHREINGEMYSVCKHWVDGAMESAQGKGLILSGLLERGKEFGLKLYYVGDGCWSCELWGATALFQETGPTAFDAVLATYLSLSQDGCAK